MAATGPGVRVEDSRGIYVVKQRRSCMRSMSAGGVAGTLESEEQIVFDVTSRKTRFQFANGLNRDK